MRRYRQMPVRAMAEVPTQAKGPMAGSCLNRGWVFVPPVGLQGKKQLELALGSGAGGPVQSVEKRWEKQGVVSQTG